MLNAVAGPHMASSGFSSRFPMGNFAGDITTVTHRRHTRPPVPGRGATGAGGRSRGAGGGGGGGTASLGGADGMGMGLSVRAIAGVHACGVCRAYSSAHVALTR